MLPLAVGLLTLAACGGADATESAGTSTSTSTEDAPTDGAVPAGGGPGGMSDELRSCLIENGVDLPEMGEGEGEAPPDGAEPPEGSAGGVPPSGQAPPGDASGGEPPAGAAGAPPGVDEDTWAAAQEACASLT